MLELEPELPPFPSPFLILFLAYPDCLVLKCLVLKNVYTNKDKEFEEGVGEGERIRVCSSSGSSVNALTLVILTEQRDQKI